MWVTALCQVAEDDMSPEDGAAEPTNDLAEMAAHLACSGARTRPMCETCWISMSAMSMREPYWT